MARARWGAAVIVTAAAIVVFVSRQNFHEVVPDRVYRSGQLAPSELEARIARHGIRSVVNLRGEKPDELWYREERLVIERHGVELRSLDLVPERLPSRPDVVALLDYLDVLPEPILVHCSAGSDRTGFASVVARMAKEGASLSEARSELSLRYGHVPLGPSSEITRIFDLYQDYLSEIDQGNGGRHFDRWARETYVPYVYSARIEVASAPASAAPSARIDVRVRVTNTSPGPWIFSTEASRGIKLGIRLRSLDAEQELWTDYDRHALQDPGRPLDAGGELELSVPLFAPRTAGRYEMKLDLVDEHVTWFEEQGSRAFLWTLSVTDPRH